MCVNGTLDVASWVMLCFPHVQSGPSVAMSSSSTLGVSYSICLICWVMGSEVNHGEYVRLLTGRSGQLLEHTGTGECTILSAGEWLLGYTDAGTAFLNLRGDADIEDGSEDGENEPVWANALLRDSLHTVTDGDAVRRYVSNRVNKTTEWVSDVVVEHQRHAVNHELAGNTLGIGVNIYRFPHDTWHMFWELPYVQHALSGSCSDPHWVKNHRPTWARRIHQLGLPASSLRPNKTALLQRGRHTGDAVQATALLDSGDEFTVSTLALIALLGHASVGHARKRDSSEGDRAQEFMFLFADHFLGSCECTLSMTGDMTSNDGHSDDDRLLVRRGWVDYDAIAGRLGRSVADEMSTSSQRLQCLPGRVVLLSSVLLALGRDPRAVNGKAPRVALFLKGLATSFARVVDLTRCEGDMWTGKHRLLPELRTASKKRRVAYELKLEVTDLAAKTHVSADAMLSSLQAWTGDSDGPSSASQQLGREWDWPIQFNYMLNGQAAWKVKGPMCLALDEVKASRESNLFVNSWSPVNRKCVWWPVQVNLCITPFPTRERHPSTRFLFWIFLFKYENNVYDFSI
jgi:hypothetical protein